MSPLVARRVRTQINSSLARHQDRARHAADEPMGFHSNTLARRPPSTPAGATGSCHLVPPPPGGESRSGTGRRPVAALGADDGAAAGGVRDVCARRPRLLLV